MISEKNYGGMEYYEYLPEGFSQNGSYPLLVHLHGAGARGGLAQVKTQGALREIENGRQLPFVVIAPHCGEGKTWFSYAERLAALTDFYRQKPFIDKTRVYLTGYSMGGYGTWSLAQEHPEWFAAIAPVCGGGMVWNAAALKDVPVWTFHGDCDKRVNIGETERMVNALRQAGGEVKFTIYEGGEHNVWTKVYAQKELYEWLLSKKRSAAIEDGRRLHRNCGAGIVLSDDEMLYPRLCAHRGFNTVAPENSMPAWGAAFALGAEEIEFDLRTTKDGVIVSIHDYRLDRVSDGTGNIENYTYEELLKFDFGIRFGEKFKGIRIVKFEDILQKFAARVIMNVHVKIWENPKFDWKIEEIVGLIRQYHCEKHMYFMTNSKDAIRKVKAYAPEIKCCMGAGENGWTIVDDALEVGADKVQLFRPYFNQEMIDKAHAHGLKCNAFWADEPDLARQYFDMGIDCILTNDYLAIKPILEEKKLKPQ